MGKLYIEDMVANLAQKVVQLERKLERLADANEQAITTVARDVERVDAELEGMRYKEAVMVTNLADLEGKTVHIVSATDYGVNGDSPIKTTVAYDIDGGKVYILGSEVIANGCK